MADLQAELRSVIERTILAHPRSAQLAIGPSEIGTPCARKLGHKLAGTRPVRAAVPAWRPTVGTAVHTWLQTAFSNENMRLGRGRYLLEARVDIGDIGTEMITGSCDLYDTDTATVVDWKVPGITTIKAARAARSPGAQYRVQTHAYGRGFVRLGLPVEHVAIYFLPAAGELGDAYFWTEPYDEQIAIDALSRADAIKAGLGAFGPAVVLSNLSACDDHCTYCPFWKPGTTDLTAACPGAVVITDAPVRNTGPAFGAVGQPKGITA